MAAQAESNPFEYSVFIRWTGIADAQSYEVQGSGRPCERADRAGPPQIRVMGHRVGIDPMEERRQMLVPPRKTGRILVCEKDCFDHGRRPDLDTYAI
jgi:hypothetical protein